jgi:hypothetical protein
MHRDPGLWPKSRVVWTIPNIGTEENFSSLHGWKKYAILVGSCADEFCDYCRSPSIKRSKRDCRQSATIVEGRGVGLPSGFRPIRRSCSLNVDIRLNLERKRRWLREKVPN